MRVTKRSIMHPAINHRTGLFRQLIPLYFLLLSIPLAGCRICATCEELDYPAYGGSWQRTIRDSGRVGSVFEPAGARVADLVSRDEPPQPDELERSRRPDDVDDNPSDENLDGEDEVNEDSEPSDEDEEEKMKELEEELRDMDLEEIRIESPPTPPTMTSNRSA